MKKGCSNCEHWLLDEHLKQYGFCSNELNRFKTTYYTQICDDYKRKKSERKPL